MSASRRFISRTLLTAIVLTAGLFLASIAPAAQCTGTWFDYFDSPAFLEIVGSKVSCPGLPDQIDTDVNGNYTETPFFTTETVVCPCGGGGGGGGGGGDQGDGEPEGE